MNIVVSVYIFYEIQLIRKIHIWFVGGNMDTLQKNVWKYNQNFSFFRLYEETHIGDIANSSLFQGTIIEKNYWKDVSISNSDLEATRIIHTTVINSMFTNADIHSLLATNTVFCNVSFQYSDITDCTFVDCQFINCSFEGATLKDSEFRNCILEKPLFLNGSYIMNSFSRCDFKSTCLKNVFYYTHFSECVFKDVSIEAYLLGFTYGLTINNLETFTYMLMGDLVDYDYRHICNEIAKIYTERKMIINQGILYLTDPATCAEQAIIKCFECLYRFIENDYIVQKEQMIFLEKIVTIMYDKKQLSPIGLIYLMNTLNEILSIKMNSSLEKAKSGLVIIQNSILSNYQYFIDELTEHLAKIPQNGEFEIKIVYEKQPTYRLTSIIKEIDSTKQAYVTKTEIGSFIEWIKCAADVLPYIDTFLNFIGVTIALATVMVTEKNNKTNSNDDNVDCIIEINNNIDVSNLSKKQLKVLPKMIENSINPVLQNDVNKTVKFILNNNFIKENDKCGYTSENIKSIEIRQLKNH